MNQRTPRIRQIYSHESRCPAFSPPGKCSGSIVLEFYFNARGSTIERSSLGLFWSLLCQLLAEIRPFPEDLFSYPKPRKRIVNSGSGLLATGLQFEHFLRNCSRGLVEVVSNLDHSRTVFTSSTQHIDKNRSTSDQTGSANIPKILVTVAPARFDGVDNSGVESTENSFLNDFEPKAFPSKIASSEEAQHDSRRVQFI